MKKAGRPKKYSDTLIFKLAILKVFLGIDAGNKFLRMMRDSKEYEYLGEIPSNSVFNNRFRTLCSNGIIMNFFEKLLEDNSDQLNSNIRIIDSEPIIFKSVKRKNSKNTRIFEMDAGFCSSLEERYFGYKLHLLVTENGLPCRFMITKASEFDNNVVMEMTYNLSDIKLVGDKGYISKKDKERLSSLRNIDKITPYRKNMKNVHLSPCEQRLLKTRLQVERAFSDFSNMNLKRCRAKSSIGVIARVSMGIVALSTIYITNKKLYNKDSIAYCKHFR